MKKILLINPWIVDYSAYDFWIQPLGLAYLSKILKNSNCEIYYINCLDKHIRVLPSGRGKFLKNYLPDLPEFDFVKRRFGYYGITEEEFRSQLKLVPKPDYILITSLMSYWYYGIKMVVKILREELEDVPYLIGGIFPQISTLQARELFDNNIIEDFNFPIILKKLSNKLELDIDINKYSKILNYEYDDQLLKRYNYRPLLTSIGCIYRCEYCISYKRFKYERKDNSLVIKKILRDYDNGIENFVFFDDNLLYEKERYIKQVLRKISEYRIEANFHLINGIHPRHIDKEIGELFRKNNFKTIRLGYEFYSKEKQESTGGKVTTEELINAIKILKQAGYKREEIGVYVLAGYPEQTIEEIKNAIDFILENEARPYLAYFSPMPLTKIFPYKNKNIDAMYHNNVVWLSYIGLLEEMDKLQNYIQNYIRKKSVNS